MDFGWPNVEIGQKMTNEKLLILALLIVSHTYVCIINVTNVFSSHSTSVIYSDYAYKYWALIFIKCHAYVIIK